MIRTKKFLERELQRYRDEVASQRNELLALRDTVEAQKGTLAAQDEVLKDAQDRISFAMRFLSGQTGEESGERRAEILRRTFPPYPAPGGGGIPYAE